MESELSITIGSLRHSRHLIGKPGVFRVDRTTPLGNPNFMATEDQRDLVCEQYKEWFHTFGRHQADVKRQLAKITEAAKTGPVILMCWCHPNRCHAETIRDAILEAMRNPEQEGTPRLNACVA